MRNERSAESGIAGMYSSAGTIPVNQLSQQQQQQQSQCQAQQSQFQYNSKNYNNSSNINNNDQRERYDFSSTGRQPPSGGSSRRAGPSEEEPATTGVGPSPEPLIPTFSASAGGGPLSGAASSTSSSSSATADPLGVAPSPYYQFPPAGVPGCGAESGHASRPSYGKLDRDVMMDGGAHGSAAGTFMMMPTSMARTVSVVPMMEPSGRLGMGQQEMGLWAQGMGVSGQGAGMAQQGMGTGQGHGYGNAVPTTSGIPVLGKYGRPVRGSTPNISPSPSSRDHSNPTASSSTARTAGFEGQPAGPGAVRDGNNQKGDPSSSNTRSFDSTLSGKHVLIAEDTALLRKVAIIRMQKLGCTVEAVNDGQQAVDAVLGSYGMTTGATDEAKRRYDAVLMDCQMPVLDGYGATAAIRAAEKGTAFHTPIVALTAHAMSSDEKKCLDSGMDAYLTKPIDPALMSSTLLRLMNKYPAYPLATN